MTSSCGCLRAKYGGLSRAHPSEYASWQKAEKRCHNPRAARYADYGGRGITMAPEWRDDFPRFLADMGPRPEGMSLDRENNDGPYAPWNCRWATTTEQNRNARRNHAITFNGETLCLAEWAARLGFRHSGATIRYRLAKGWSVERALTEPLAQQPALKTLVGRRQKREPA